MLWVAREPGRDPLPQVDIRLSALDRDDWQTELAMAFPNERSVEAVLRRTTFPPGRIPTFANSTALEVWGEILIELDRGVMQAGNYQLLHAAIRFYPANPVFHRLAETYLPAGPTNDSPGAEAAQPGEATPDEGDRMPLSLQSGPRPTGHAFISYVHENAPEVDRLQGILEAAGVRVWRDTEDLWPGEDWRAMIRRAITDDALVFLACFSRKSLARQRSYQNEELVLAIDQMRLRRPGDPWLIPVRFDDCEIPDLDVGGGRSLSSIQRADLFGPRFDNGAARLTVAVKRILGQ